MPTTTPNLGLTLPTPNVDTGWGGTLNADFTTIDSVFAAAGSGPSVGLNVGAGKTINVGGTLVGAGTIILGSGDGTGTVASPTIRGAARTGTNAVGANLVFDAPNGTGTGGSGNFLFRTAAPGASGAVANTFQNAFSISQAGTVGIGTSFAGAKLEIADPNQFYIALNRTSGAGYKQGILYQKAGISKFEVGVDISNNGTNDYYIYDSVAAATRFMINQNGAASFAYNSYGTAGQVLTSQGSGAPPVWAGTSDTRTWVVFNGTVSSPVIAAGSNVSSVTKNGTGDYTINFTTALSTANYAVAITGMSSGIQAVTGMVNANTPPTTSSVRIQLSFYQYPANSAGSSAMDSSRVSVIIFG